ncbi:kinase-like protein [Diaporthe eres]|uniref:non-specific serine/threonine protein kinase n=1 Tax=Diaporthe vaccinii TaxID=105482 RepID=A0ABR4E262_9PEZI|nr:kinase-like protein [Diaporthe eres]
MSATVRRRRPDDFQIHQDGPSTEDTEMNTDAAGGREEEYLDEEDQEQEQGQSQERSARGPNRDVDEEEDEEPELDEDDEDEEESDEEEILDDDMRRLQDAFPGFRRKYKLIKRIGEGTFSTVYKAEDLQYDRYENKWDVDKENESWTPPPLKRHVDRSSSSSATIDQASELTSRTARQHRTRSRFVAIKKIYVTSSPSRILNELELLHDLRDCPAVCPLITAFRSTDQVIAILPYFRHHDFRDYFRNMTIPDMAVYLRSLFTALSAVHRNHIIHRDIKPTNFLYDPSTQRGVLVDFGLAEREGEDSKPCYCHEEPSVRRQRLRAAVMANGGPHRGFPKNDTRPSRRANRAGTRGFRAPEVLFKCTEQTTKLDIWSAGVILLTIMSRRFPFFNSADDVEAMIEIATIFGHRRMRIAGQQHGCMFDTTIPTIGQNGFDLGKIIMWSTLRDEKKQPFSDEERIALDFLARCMELDPSKRIDADEALEHEFLMMGKESQGNEEEDMDVLPTDED